MVNVHCATIKLWIHLGGLLSTQEARVVLGYCLTLLSCIAASRVHPQLDSYMLQAARLCTSQIEASTSPRSYPRHLTPFPARKGGHLITTHKG